MDLIDESTLEELSETFDIELETIEDLQDYIDYNLQQEKGE